jgi:hypothetical protein
MKLDDFITRVEELIALGDATSATRRAAHGVPVEYLNEGLAAQFRAAALSFLRNVYGEHHSHYTDFERHTTGRIMPIGAEKARGVLVAVRDEMKGGWLRTAKGLVSAEIFTDFLEMAEHLLSNGYKDAAAVMTGSVLEEHLRQVASRFTVTATNDQGKPKKAEILNHDLVKASAYNMLDSKQITGWLDLRNKAAHGHYGDYSAQQVRNMLDGVTNFMARISP